MGMQTDADHHIYDKKCKKLDHFFFFVDVDVCLASTSNWRHPKSQFVTRDQKELGALAVYLGILA
jgi:hypothetical protein